MAKKTQAREPRVKLLVSILPPENEIPMTEICNEFCVSLHFSGIGFGTVRSNYRTYLGLDETEKRILYAQFLINNGMSPTQAYEQCNYNEYSTFYRQYKKFLETMPKNDKK